MSADIALCQHMKTNGVFCGSPALRGKPYCYFHDQWRRTRPNLKPVAFELPLLEDANAIQMALQRVIRALHNGELDTKTAGLILYALQTASSNLKRTNFEPREELEQQAQDDFELEESEEPAQPPQEAPEIVGPAPAIHEPVQEESKKKEEVLAAPSAQRHIANRELPAAKPAHKPPASELSDPDLMKMLRALTRAT